MKMDQMRVGVWLYGLATIATGILDVVWRQFEASHQPIKSLGQHIPGEPVLAVIAGIWLIAAGIAILWRPTARIGAASAAIIYLIFALFWVPRFYVITHQLGSSNRCHSFRHRRDRRTGASGHPGSHRLRCDSNTQCSMARQSDHRRSLDVGIASHNLRLRTPHQSFRLRALRPTLGAVWSFLGSADRHRFPACRQCNYLGNSGYIGREAAGPDALIV